MPYICLHCGEKDEFKREVHGSVYFDRTDYIDSEGDVTDYGDSDYGDEDAVDVNIICTNCGSEDIDDVEQDEWENFDLEYYQENGEYYDDTPPVTWKEKMKKIIKKG